MNRYRIGVLLYFRSLDDRLLLIRRIKHPIETFVRHWGKLEMETGESPSNALEGRQRRGRHGDR